MTEDPVRIDPVPPATFDDDRYPWPPDERYPGIVPLHRDREPIWPEEHPDFPDYDAKRDEIRRLSDDLQQLRRAGSYRERCYTVACPRCGARPGAPCRTRSGGQAFVPHTARARTAREAEDV